jgi:predicted  nucleic acid-binding Zn-ribbon protein
MSASSQAIRALHELHLKLHEVQENLARGPRQIAAKQTAVDKRKAELESRRDKLKQLKMSADQKNLQLKTNEAKINDLRNKLNAAASNREYEIITGQIAADTMANSVLEDEILEALTRIDQMQGEVKQAEQDLATAEASLKQTQADVAAREPGLSDAAAALQKEVGEAEKFLPPDIVPQYRRAVQGFGAEALAAVENRVCSACHMQLTPQRMVELRSGKLMFCGCGRLLYTVDA